MSYCRWSSDNWKCDIYSYKSGGGIVTHIATDKIIGDVPEVPDILKVSAEEYLKADEKQMDFLDNCKMEKIGLPYDGETFVDPDEESFLKRLIELWDIGYHVPGYVIEKLEEGIKNGEGG